MTVTPYGFAGNINAQVWTWMAPLLAKADDDGMAVSGFTPTRSALAMSYAIGQAVGAGVGADSDAVVTLTHDAQASGTRRDYDVLRLDWSAKTATVMTIPGSSSATPKLETTPGARLDIPLATVDVTSAGATFIDRRPLAEASIALAFGGNWTTNANFPLTLRKSGSIIQLAGRTARTTNTLGEGDVTQFNIPAGFWPADTASGLCSTGGDAPDGIASMAWHRLEVYPDGSASFRAGSAITAGTNVHIHMTWIGA